MLDSQEKLREIQEELKWVTIKEQSSFKDKVMSKGIVGVLVPIGCLATTGILISGVYNLIKRDSRKQQMLMRYRVVAQGVTVFLTTVGLLQLKFSS